MRSYWPGIFLALVISLCPFQALAGDAPAPFCHFPDKMSDPAAPEADFLGDRVVTGLQPNIIDRLVLTLELPRKAHWVKSQPSKVRLWTPKQGVILEATLKGTKTAITVGKAINEEKLFVLAELYYCLKDKEDLCVSRDVLFEMPLGMAMDIADVNVHYKIPKD